MHLVTLRYTPCVLVKGDQGPRGIMPRCLFICHWYMEGEELLIPTVCETSVLYSCTAGGSEQVSALQLHVGASALMPARNLITDAASCMHACVCCLNMNVCRDMSYAEVSSDNCHHAGSLQLDLRVVHCPNTNPSAHTRRALSCRRSSWSGCCGAPGLTGDPSGSAPRQPSR